MCKVHSRIFVTSDHPDHGKMNLVFASRLLKPAHGNHAQLERRVSSFEKGFFTSDQSRSRPFRIGTGTEHISVMDPYPHGSGTVPGSGIIVTDPDPDPAKNIRGDK